MTRIVSLQTIALQAASVSSVVERIRAARNAQQKVVSSEAPVGERFGILTVLSAEKQPDGRFMWVCICDCGNVKRFKPYNLVRGSTRTCGCGRHYMTKTPTYESWRSMRSRCDYERHPHFKHYGGRGVTYCDRWRFFENFLEDMGERPPGTTLGRIDNSRGYEKDNCEWQSRSEQARNKRTTRFETAFGETKCLAAWGEDRRARVGLWTLKTRLRKGWEFVEALTTPPTTRGSNFRKAAA